VLESVLKPRAGIQLGSYVEDEGKALFNLTKEKGMEGIIAKRKEAGGLPLDSGMAGIREIVTMTVVIEAADGHRAVFSLAELCPDFVDRAGAGCVKSRRLPFIALVGVHGYYCWSIRNNWVDLVKTNHRDL
jgi:hypothetical protein